MIESASAALELPPSYLHPGQIRERPKRLIKAVLRADIVFVFRREIPEVRRVAKVVGRPDLPIIAVPRLYFPGFHPDATMSVKPVGKYSLPMSNVHSAIVLAAFRSGLSVGDTLTLFRDEVFEALGYYDAFALAVETLSAECRQAGLDVEPLMKRWMAAAPFFYVPLHPTIAVLRDVALTQLRNAGLFDGKSCPAVDDALSRKLVWPVYPEIGDRLGISGDYLFRPGDKPTPDNPHMTPMGLETFVERTFAAYKLMEPKYSDFPRLNDPRFSSIRRFVREKRSLFGASNYKDAPAKLQLAVINSER